MKLPSRKQCLGFLKETNLLENIVKHSLAVNRVAVFLAKRMKKNGVKVDVKAVDCGSLVHDLDKHLTFENHLHGYVGKKFLVDKGFSELGDFCITHNLSFVLKNDLPSIEHRIVFYADKRVKADRIVSLDERFDYIREKYGARSPEALKKILSCKKPLLKIEKELLSLAKVDASLGGLQ